MSVKELLKELQGTESPGQLRSILAYVDGGSGSADVIKVAAKMGKSYSAYVEVLHIEKSIEDALPTMDMGGSLVAASEIFEIMKQEAEKRVTHAKTQFDTFCKKEKITPISPDSQESVAPKGLALSWNLIQGNDNRDLAHRGRLFDLIVMAKANDQIGGVDSVQLEAALFDTGRPVLVISDKSDVEHFESIVVAWDGSREAAHSVALAMPLLTKAEKVYVMVVGNSEPGMGGADVSRYLARHGVDAEQCPLVTSDKSIAEALGEASLEKGASLLVMGAYGHSALGESLFGGVTRDLLEEGKIPLLLAH